MPGSPSADGVHAQAPIAADGQPQSRQRSLWEQMVRARQAYFLLAPVFLVLLIFVYYPPLSGLYHAFFDWTPGQKSSFVGLANFQRSFGDNQFWQDCWNMARLVIAGAVTSACMPLFVAMLIFHLRSAVSKELYRLLVISPTLIPGIVTILIWRYIYDPNLGVLNAFLRFAGLGVLTHDWLGDYHTALYAIIFIGFPWINGTNVLIYLAGLNNIAPEVLEAAELDDCVGFARARLIEVPLITGQIRLLVTLSVITAIQGFEAILVLTDGGPGFATEVPALRTYDAAFSAGEMGYASSIGLLLFLLCMVLTLLINRSWTVTRSI